MFGLPENVIQLLKDYFKSQPQILKVLVYGSRAMGREKPGSDVDLAIITNSERDLSGAVREALEALPTPYLFDVVDYRQITHLPLREHIDRVGKLLFERTEP